MEKRSNRNTRPQIPAQKLQTPNSKLQTPNSKLQTPNLEPRRTKHQAPSLISIIDEHTFGDLKSFREQFPNLSQAQVFNTLKARLAPICHRTLRRQVTAYVPYTRRHAILEKFDPGESEDRLYHLVSDTPAGSSSTRAQTRSPVPAPQTCAPPSWIISARTGAS